VFCPQHTTTAKKCDNVYYLNEGGTEDSPGEDTLSDRVVRKGLTKSVAILREVLRIYSKPGDIVLELCSGSAPGARASVYEGRMCVAVDCDELVVNAVKAHLEDLHTTVNEKLDNIEQQPTPQPEEPEEERILHIHKKKKHNKDGKGFSGDMDGLFSDNDEQL
jgi:DNA modification methylase